MRYHMCCFAVLGLLAVSGVLGQIPLDGDDKLDDSDIDTRDVNQYQNVKLDKLSVDNDVNQKQNVQREDDSLENTWGAEEAEGHINSGNRFKNRPGRPGNGFRPSYAQDGFNLGGNFGGGRGDRRNGRNGNGFLGPNGDGRGRPGRGSSRLRGAGRFPPQHTAGSYYVSCTLFNAQNVPLNSEIRDVTPQQLPWQTEGGFAELKEGRAVQGYGRYDQVGAKPWSNPSRLGHPARGSDGSSGFFNSFSKGSGSFIGGSASHAYEDEYNSAQAWGGDESHISAGVNNGDSRDDSGSGHRFRPKPDQSDVANAYVDEVGDSSEQTLGGVSEGGRYQTGRFSGEKRVTSAFGDSSSVFGSEHSMNVGSYDSYGNVGNGELGGLGAGAHEGTDAGFGTYDQGNAAHSTGVNGPIPNLNYGANVAKGHGSYGGSDTNIVTDYGDEVSDSDFAVGGGVSGIGHGVHGGLVGGAGRGKDYSQFAGGAGANSGAHVSASHYDEGYAAFGTLHGGAGGISGGVHENSSGGIGSNYDVNASSGSGIHDETNSDSSDVNAMQNQYADLGENSGNMNVFQSQGIQLGGGAEGSFVQSQKVASD